MTVLANLDTVSLAVIVGVLAPLLTAVVQQPQWSTRTRRLVAVGVAVVLGALTALSKGEITDTTSLLAAVATVLTSSQATYGTLWGAATQAIEQRTSPSQALEGHVDDAQTEPGQHRAAAPPSA